MSDSGCWIWQRGQDGKGYGAIGLRGGRYTKTHRAAYMAFVGPIPDGLELDHLCRNTICCNPDHLEPVTHRENMRRSPLLASPGDTPACAIYQLRKTHCPSGHPYAGDNLGVRASGGRYCRQCARERMARNAARKKASA